MIDCCGKREEKRKKKHYKNSKLFFSEFPTTAIYIFMCSLGLDERALAKRDRGRERKKNRESENFKASQRALLCVVVLMKIQTLFVCRVIAYTSVESGKVNQMFDHAHGLCSPLNKLIRSE